MKTLRINPEYLAMVPRPNNEEYKALEQSIIDHKGAYEPIKINKYNIILDGHTRYDICTKHKLPFKTKIINFLTELDEKLYVIDTNLKRRNLNAFQRGEIELVGIPLLLEKAKLDVSLNRDPNIDLSHGTRNVISMRAGIGHTTATRIKLILEKGSKELIQKARDGRISIREAYTQVILNGKHEPTPDFPKGVYNVLYADPPWEYNVMLRGSPTDHYPTMKLGAIETLEVPAAKDAILFLWATNPKLVEALEVIKAWGFEYKTNIVWVKDKIGTGYCVRGQHELLLIAKKGKMPPPMCNARPSSLLDAPTLSEEQILIETRSLLEVRRTKHSEKPKEIYDVIERMYPNGRYVELFARNTRSRWVSWGNEV